MQDDKIRDITLFSVCFNSCKNMILKVLKLDVLLLTYFFKKQVPYLSKKEKRAGSIIYLSENSRITVKFWGLGLDNH